MIPAWVLRDFAKLPYPHLCRFGDHWIAVWANEEIGADAALVGAIHAAHLRKPAG